jgi:hypothetical protein
MIWKRIFEVVKWRGRKWTLTKKFWKYFLLSKYWILLFQKRETYGAFLPFSLFFSFFSMLLSLPFFYAPSLYCGWTQGFLKCLRRKQFVFKHSFKWDGSGYTEIYEIGGVAENLSVVDAYPKMDLCTPNFFCEASSKILWRKNHFEKFKSSRRTHPLTKLNENKSCYVEYIWLW